jgi:MFS family permease
VIKSAAPPAPATAALRSRGLRRYLVGQLPSVACSWAQVIALSWLVARDDPAALGWLVALQFLPSLLLGPWCGALADRYDRRTLLILAEAGLGAVALGYAALAASGLLTLPAVLALAAAWGVCNALDTPARRALVPMLVPPAHTTGAVAFTGVAMLVGMTIGTALGPLLIATIGVAGTFAVNAGTFLADVLILATIRVGPSPRVPRAPGQIRAGLAHAWRTPVLRGALATLAVAAVFGFHIQVSVPTLLVADFGEGATLFGYAFTAGMLGSLAGTLAAVRTSARVTLGAATTVVGLAAAGAAPTLPLLLGALMTVGFGWSYLVTAVLATLQSTAPELLGRVMALFGIVLLGGMASAGPLAAFVAAVAGPRAPFLLGAAVLGTALLVHPADRSTGEPATAA